MGYKFKPREQNQSQTLNTKSNQFILGRAALYSKTVLYCPLTHKTVTTAACPALCADF